MFGQWNVSNRVGAAGDGPNGDVIARDTFNFCSLRVNPLTASSKLADNLGSRLFLGVSQSESEKAWAGEVNFSEQLMQGSIVPRG